VTCLLSMVHILQPPSIDTIKQVHIPQQDPNGPARYAAQLTSVRRIHLLRSPQLVLIWEVMSWLQFEFKCRTESCYVQLSLAHTR
jgi:hypothetical protein